MSTPTDHDNVAAHLAISNVLAVYCHAVDGREREGLLSCFWDDAIDEHGAAASGHPRELADWLDAKIPGFDTTMHHLGTVHVQLDGDRADVRSTVIAAHVGRPTDDPRSNFVSAGRYHDVFTRRGGEWRIQHRRALKEWETPSRIEATNHIGVPTGKD